MFSCKGKETSMYNRECETKDKIWVLQEEVRLEFLVISTQMGILAESRLNG